MLTGEVQSAVHGGERSPRRCPLAGSEARVATEAVGVVRPVGADALPRQTLGPWEDALDLGEVVFDYLAEK